MDQENKENKQEGKRVSKRNKILIIVTSILLLIVIILLIVRGCSKNTDNSGDNIGNNDDINEPEHNDEQDSVKYRNALMSIANKEYKKIESLNDSNNYISYISSYALNNNSFIFVAKTNLASNNKYIGVNISNSSITSLDSAFTYISNNYSDLSTATVGVDIFDEYLESNTAINNAINIYTNGASKKIVDIFDVPNPNLLMFSISYMDGEDLVTAIGDYSVSYASSDLISASTSTTRVDSSKKSYIDIIEFK